MRIGIPRFDPTKSSTLPLAGSALWALFVYWTSTTPSPPAATAVARAPFERVDLLVHFGLFLVMAVLLRWLTATLPGHGTAMRMGRTVAPVVVAVIFGGAIELIQRNVVGRSGEWVDAAANGLGALTAVVLFEAIASVSRRRVRRVSALH